MSKEKEEEIIIDVEQVYSKSETWVIENQKSLTIIVGAIILLAASYFAYNNFIYEPAETEAREQIWKAQRAFEIDSFNLALNGRSEPYQMGFLGIIDEYGISEQANLARYYAGICYLNLGQYDDAINYLDEFDCNDIVVCAIAMGATGDAYMEKGETDRALDYYLNAVDHSENDLTTPIYMMKAGRAHEALEQYAEAAEMYTMLKDKFPNSPQAESIDKFIARAEVLAGN